MTRVERNRRDAPRTLGGHQGAADAPVRRFPVPSLLDGRTYLLIESRGPSDEAWVQRQGTRGQMKVPTGSEGAARRIRLHEMAHVRWTPVGQEPEGVTHETLNAVEDRRMHKRLREIGYGDQLDHYPIIPGDAYPGLSERLLTLGDPDPDATDPPAVTPLDVARMICASDGTYEADRFRRVISEAGLDWIIALTDTVMERNGMNGRRPAWKRTCEAARDLEDALREMEEVPAPLKRKFPEYGEEPGSGEWGRMTVREMPMPDRLPRTIKVRKRYATDTGAVPRNWHRAMSDGRVFTARRNRPAGGTVLLDQSGSMGLDADEVMALMEQFPGVTIATYAGRNDRGELRVIARNGRRATPQDCLHPMNGNVIDGPALDWLNDQPGPRVWVSDGYVTGTSDHGADPALLLDAAAKVRAGRIIMADRLGDLFDEGDTGGPGR